MTTKRNLKTADKVLDEEQLDQVNGGFLLVAGATAVAVAAFQTARKTGMAVYTETEALVKSSEYAKMTDSEKNKAIGKIFSNNVAFGAMLGTGAGLIYAQTKWRFAGVSDTLREGIEDVFK